MDFVDSHFSRRCFPVMKCTALVLAACAAFAAAAPAEDAVPTLPGFGAPAQDTYSGYLTVKGTAKRLHYLFVRAQTNAANAPVVLWLNGGAFAL